MASNSPPPPPPNDDKNEKKDEIANDVENAWIPLTVLLDDVTSSTSLLAALDLAQAKVPLQRRGNYRPIGAFAMRPPGRGGGLASERSIDSHLTSDAVSTTATTTTTTTTTANRSLFRVPVADVVVHDIEIAEVYPGHPILPAAAADSTIATVATNHTDTPEPKSYSAATARSSQGSLVRRMQCFRWCGRDSSSSNRPYCSRLFYTVLCLLLVVFLIVAIFLTVKVIQDKQEPQQTTKKKWLVPTLNKNTTAPAAPSLGNDAN
jgi:hypothetical protein